MSHPDLIPAPGPEKGVGGVVASADPIDRLPPEAAARLHRLRRLRDRAADLLQPANRRQEDAYNRLRRAQDQLRDIEAAYRQGRIVHTEEQLVPYAQRTEEGQRARVQVVRRVAPDEKRLQAERLVVERLSREVEEHRDEQHSRGAMFQNIASAVARCEKWITELPRRAVLRAWEGETPKLRKGETTADATVRCEQMVNALRHAAAGIKAAPVHSTEALARINAAIDALAAEPDVYDAIEGAPLAWPRERVTFQGFSSTGDNVSGGVSLINTLGVVAWLLRDTLKERLAAEVARAADDDNALTDVERREKLAANAAECLAVERTLAALYEMAEEGGAFVFPLENMAPAAILGVVDPAARENAT